MIQIPQNLCTEITDKQASSVQGGLKVTIDTIKAIEVGADKGSDFFDFVSFLANDDTQLFINGKLARDFGGESFGNGSIRKPGITQDIGKSGTIKLVDSDKGNFLRGGDDPMGSFTVNGPTNGLVTKTISGSGSTYDVTYSVSA